MPSFKNLLLAVTLAATATAATCPKNWLENTPPHSETKCCYGDMFVEDRDAYCCIYEEDPEAMLARIATQTETETSVPYDSWSTAGECHTKIPFTASDYSDQVSSASSKLVAASTSTAIAMNEATTATASSSSGSKATSPAAASSTTRNAAMPIATAQEMMLGGVAVVAGLFVL